MHILPIGLSNVETIMLSSLSQVSSLGSRSQCYTLAKNSQEPSDVYLVNSDDHPSMNTWRSIHNQRPAPTLFLSTQNRSIEDHVVLCRPIIPARLLSALDNLSVEENVTEEIVITDVALAEQFTVAPSCAPNTQPKSPGTRVLIAYGNAKIRHQLAISLKPYWVSVDFAESGNEVSQKLSESFYDLVFLDTEFADMNGFQLCKRIKKNPLFAKTPSVMLDRQPSLYRRMLATMASCDSYLPMPVSHSKLDDCLNKHLSAIRGVVDPYNSRQFMSTFHAA